MITRAQITRRADVDGVAAQTVERDYVLAHVLSALAHLNDERLVFKGGTALRYCFLDECRYSADLDLSLVDVDKREVEKLRCVIQRLQCRDLLDLHAGFEILGVDPSAAAMRFEAKARHRTRLGDYQRRWQQELGEHLADVPHFDGIERRVTRSLRDGGLLS